MNLSPKQQSIVDHIDGALLVKAGPGSGKTRVLTERVKHLLSVKKRGKVLALTFSNMAAEEMRSRLESDPDVGNSIGRVVISTIHSFCLDLIQSRGYLVGLRPDVSLFENEADRTAILRNMVLNEPEYTDILQKQERPNVLLSNYLSRISEQKRALILPEASNVNEPFPAIYRKYNDALASQNAMDFDDILFFTYRILAENIDVVKLYNSVYRYICIDEAQDLNEAQYRVIQALCGNDFRNIMMVGDENQSIYAFNGSSSKYMSKFFVRDFSPTTYTLDENFRSAKQIIKYANSLTGNKEDISRYYYEGELKISSFQNEVEEAQSVRSAIEQLIISGHKDIEGELTYDKIAVIARNKYVLAGVESELTQVKIPYYYKKTLSGIACETDSLKAFDLILRLIVNPMDLYHKQLLCKLAGQKMSESVNSENIGKVIEQLLTESKFRWLSGVIQNITTDGTVNFDNVLQSLRSSIPQTLSDDDKYLLEKDIDEWNNHWKRFKARVPRENRTLVSFRNAIALGKTQDLEADSGVALLTAHMSKGLEFEVVFVIGLAEGIFPDYRAVNSGGEAIVQEKNNMYVAATRAKRLCYLSYPQIKRMPWGDNKRQEPSRFIANYRNSEETTRR
jgi:DNA helicase-2/ATP-dependent DNA helicase PcrA